MRFVLAIAIILAAVDWLTGRKLGTDSIFGPPETLQPAEIRPSIVSWRFGGAQ